MSVTSLSFDPSGIQLDPRGGLSRQLYQALRERVLDGRLPSNTRLPASRDLARTLGISRNSVVRAYDQLYAEGFIESRVGDGTYIAKLSTAPKKPPQPASHEVIPSPAETLVAPAISTGPPRAFRVGIAAFDLFPFTLWAQLQARFWRNPDPALLGYADAMGDKRLREMIAAYLRGARGLHCDAGQIIITNGAQQAISLCGQVLLKPGNDVAVENPGYRSAVSALSEAGGRPVGIPVDNQGLDCAELLKAEGCRLVYVTPSHQYPSGVTMSLARRLELLEWAKQRDGYIIEDDYDSEYRYSGAPLAPLAALDQQGRVLYVGTFSKVAFPGLRLGFLLLPPGLVAEFARRRGAEVRHSEIGTQQVMAEFMAAGHFQRHIRRMRRAARSRLLALQEAWPVDIPGCAPFPTIEAGLHLSMLVDNHEREAELVDKARAAGVEINRLSDYWLRDSNVPVDKRAGLVLGFAGVNEVAIKKAVAELRRVWRV